MLQFVGRYHVLTGEQNFMDALREQYEGGFKMSAYKDKTQGPGMWDSVILTGQERKHRSWKESSRQKRSIELWKGIYKKNCSGYENGDEQFYLSLFWR